MIVRIQPGRARGTVAAPPSKSMAHRLLLCAGLAEGESRIRNVAPSEDVLATLDCLRALGAEVRREGDAVAVRGTAPGRFPAGARLACRESGSTLRFFVPVCLLGREEIRLEGSARLMARPLEAYREICAARGLEFALSGRELRVRGPLEAGKFGLPGDVSSQYASGLLFAAPLLAGDSRIRFRGEPESRPYVEMTCAALAASGVETRWADGRTLEVPGGQAFRARNAEVEGDWSGTAFFLALNALGGEVAVSGLAPDSLQGDRVCGRLLAELAAGRPEIALEDCPDLAPVLFAVAAARNGARFTGTRRLRFKESDRVAAMAAELRACGASVEAGENEVEVGDGGLHAPERLLRSHGDHRVAMALAVLLTALGGGIEGAEAVAKSMPDFFGKLAALGIGAEITENGRKTP